VFVKIRPVLSKGEMGLSDSYLKLTDKTVKVHQLILPSSTPISRPSKGFTFDKVFGWFNKLLMNANHSLNGLQMVKMRLLCSMYYILLLNNFNVCFTDRGGLKYHSITLANRMWNIYMYFRIVFPQIRTLSKIVKMNWWNLLYLVCPSAKNCNVVMTEDTAT
jgi:hypothetical protein